MVTWGVVNEEDADLSMVGSRCDVDYGYIRVMEYQGMGSVSH